MTAMSTCIKRLCKFTPLSDIKILQSITFCHEHLCNCQPKGQNLEFGFSKYICLPHWCSGKENLDVISLVLFFTLHVLCFRFFKVSQYRHFCLIALQGGWNTALRRVEYCINLIFVVPKEHSVTIHQLLIITLRIHTVFITVLVHFQ